MIGETERARSALWSLDPGTDRDTWVRHGMGAKAAGLGFDDFHNWSAGAGNYKNEAECRSVWNSIKDGGVTAASLFRAALATGWQDPAKSRTKGTHFGLPIAKPSPSPARPVKTPPGMSPVEVWSRCIPATPAEPYIYRKQGKPDGLRVYPASAPPLIIRGQTVTGYLVAPCYAPDGNTLLTLQFIPPDGGDKLNLPGAQFGNGFFTVGTMFGGAHE